MVTPVSSTASIPPWPAPYIRASPGPRLHVRATRKAAYRPHSSNTPAASPPYRAYNQRFPASTPPRELPSTARLTLPSSTRANRGKIIAPSRKNRHRPPVRLRNHSPSPRGSTTVNRATRIITAMALWLTAQRISFISASLLSPQGYTLHQGESQGSGRCFLPSTWWKVSFFTKNAPAADFGRGFFHSFRNCSTSSTNTVAPPTSTLMEVQPMLQPGTPPVV